MQRDATDGAAADLDFGKGLHLGGLAAAKHRAYNLRVVTADADVGAVVEGQGGLVRQAAACTKHPTRVAAEVLEECVKLVTVIVIQVFFHGADMSALDVDGTQARFVFEDGQSIAVIRIGGTHRGQAATAIHSVAHRAAADSNGGIAEHATCHIAKYTAWERCRTTTTTQHAAGVDVVKEGLFVIVDPKLVQSVPLAHDAVAHIDFGVSDDMAILGAAKHGVGDIAAADGHQGVVHIAILNSRVRT